MNGLPSEEPRITTFTEAGALDFAPAILRAQRESPPPLPRVVLYGPVQ